MAEETQNNETAQDPSKQLPVKDAAPATAQTTVDTKAKDASGSPAVGRKAGEASLKQAVDIEDSAKKEANRESTSEASEAAADKIAEYSHRPAITNYNPEDADHIDVEAMAGPTRDDKVAQDEQLKHPGAPLYDPNEIPVHENRVEVGTRIQKLQRRDHIDLINA